MTFWEGFLTGKINGNELAIVLAQFTAEHYGILSDRGMSDVSVLVPLSKEVDIMNHSVLRLL